MNYLVENSNANFGACQSTIKHTLVEFGKWILIFIHILYIFYVSTQTKLYPLCM